MLINLKEVIVLLGQLRMIITLSHLRNIFISSSSHMLAIGYHTKIK